MRARRGLALTVLGLGAYDAVIRPWMLHWGSTEDERRRALPGDEVTNETVPAGMARHTRAVTIDAPPEAVWPWLVQVGDRRAGFYSYDWFERATGTVHYVEGRHSATRIHPELQDVKVGDRIDTGSIGRDFRIGSPVTVLEPNHALVMGTWAFVLQPIPGGRTRLLVREPYPGWIRQVMPARSGLLRALGAAIDYAIGEPLHFAMERKMMFGLRQRAEQGPRQSGHNAHTAVLVDIRGTWSDGKVEHAPAGAELFHTRALDRTPELRGPSRYHLASDEEIRAFAVEAPFVEEAVNAELAYLRLAIPRADDERLQPAGEPR